MSNLPGIVNHSRLWNQLSAEPSLQHAVTEIRNTTEIIAAKIGEVIPEFTDHSVLHLDALWQVADQVLTDKEMRLLTVSEAFVLASSFYVHDLGMAVAATSEGADTLRKSNTYKATEIRLTQGNIPPEQARVMALRIAAREGHAKQANVFTTEILPGLGRYLIENSELRSRWAGHIGQVAESHHWALADVDRVLGSRGRVPDPLGNTIDLAFVACALRVIDYAHINMARAPSLERLLRSSIPPESLQHWRAQEHITGPIRENNQLVFGSTQAISDVDAWWTFYEMASGLDREITAVNEYLAGRAVSSGRFSLEGVKGVKTPQSFAVIVPTGGFEPLDVRFRPDSMERLIGILGGRTLYGNDFYAPVRELLQNARDAVLLYQASYASTGATPEAPQISVALETDTNGGTLTIKDNGVGMSAHVIANYLLGIAADYWNSPDFYGEYPTIAGRGFQAVGRFGIGFLSVFMLGDFVEVQTQRRGAHNLLLRLYGVGRRGALLRRSPTFANGTTVRVRISADRLADFSELSKVILGKAPMLDIPVALAQGDSTVDITPKWWQTVSQEELSEFLDQRDLIATTPPRLRDKQQMSEIDDLMRFRHHYRQDRTLSNINRLDKWPGNQPEVISNDFRILAVPAMGHVLLCSKGFAIMNVPMEGLYGLVDVGELELNTARSQALNWHRSKYREEWMSELRPSLVSALDGLVTEGNIPARFQFLSRVAELYGIELLLETSLPWLTVVEPPGNSRLVNPQEARELLKNAAEIFLVYGAKVSPWNATEIARARFPEASRDALVIPVSSDGQPEIGSYRDDDKVIWDSLPEHFKSERTYAKRSIDQATLLLATLTTVSQQWQITWDKLYKSRWSRHNQTLCGLLVRDPENN